MKTKWIALLLAVVMVVGLLSPTAFAAKTEEMTVVVSMEGLTLGQGMYVEPKAYTLDEINTLVATEGYGPYTEDTLTAAMATLAMMIDNNLEYTNTGSWDSGMYLSGVKGIDKGTVNIPSVITEKGGPDNDSHDGNDDEYLGEFDYSFMSGWMITVNDFMIDVGCSDWNLKNGVSSGKCQDYGNTYVVRWHFTLWGYGGDLGFNTGWGNEAYFDHVNKDKMYAAYARSTDAAAKASVLPTMENLTATAADVAAAEAALAPNAEPAPGESQDVTAILNDTMAQLAATVTEPAFGTFAGEWTVLSLARGGYYAQDNAYFSDYYSRIVATVNETAASVNLNGALHKNKSTDNSRLILALSSIGKDATSVGNWNLITPFDDFTWIKKQGINGPIFALIALDTHDYQTVDTTIRQQCIDYILDKQLDDGGWALSGTTSDPDITAMTLQALVTYKDQVAVAAAAEKAFAWLSSAQAENGGYASWGTANSESIAQVIVACTAWGINPDTDTRFVKANGSAVDAILTFYDATAKGFRHVSTGNVDAMATDQACYALVAYDRFLKGKTALYDMSDVTFETVSPVPDPSAPKLTGMEFFASDLDVGLTPAFDEDVLTGYSVTLKSGKSSMSIKVTAPEGCTVTAKHQGLNENGNPADLEYALSTTGWDSIDGLSEVYGEIPVQITVADSLGNSTTYMLTIVHPDPNAISAILGLPAQVEAGQSFQAILSLDQWNNEAGYKLMDFMMTIPEGLTVTGVTVSDRLSGGEVSYHVEAETGKLRVVYFDANENANLTISGTEFPAEVFTVSFTVSGATAGTSLPVAISGMSVKLTSDSADENAMIIVNTETANGSIQVVQGISFSAVMLYQGDDVDLIPSTKKAVAVAVTGIAPESKLQYNDGTHEIAFLYSPEISAKTGVSSYVALVDASVDMTNFVKASYYTIPGTGAETLTFGDANGDGVVNAQDALVAVDCWLRKGVEPTDLDILTLNVNGDSRINTFDALGIVEAFVNGTDYAVVTKATNLATNP